MSEIDERYQRGKIYCLRSHQTDLVYIGSTIQGLAERIGGHRADYRMWLKGTYHYVTSFEIVKYDDAYIELVEDYPCKTKAELERREGQVMRDTENCCNRIIAGRTYAEYYIDNKEKIVEYGAKWRAENKDKLIEQNAKYYQDNKEKYKEQMSIYYCENREELMKKMRNYYNENKEKFVDNSAKYREKNKGAIAEKTSKWQKENKEKVNNNCAKYYKNNKEKIKQKASVKVQCECGVEMNRSSLSRHRKTKKHQKWVDDNLKS